MLSNSLSALALALLTGWAAMVCLFGAAVVNAYRLPDPPRPAPDLDDVLTEARSIVWECAQHEWTA